jgi:hypothetical protein
VASDGQGTINNPGLAVSAARAASNVTSTTLVNITPSANAYQYLYFAAVS